MSNFCQLWRPGLSELEPDQTESLPKMRSVEFKPLNVIRYSVANGSRLHANVALEPLICIGRLPRSRRRETGALGVNLLQTGRNVRRKKVFGRVQPRKIRPPTAMPKNKEPRSLARGS